MKTEMKGGMEGPNPNAFPVAHAMGPLPGMPLLSRVRDRIFSRESCGRSLLLDLGDKGRHRVLEGSILPILCRETPQP